MWRCCFPTSAEDPPIHLNGIQLLRIVGSNHHHPSGSNHVAKFDDVPAKLWLVGGFWGSNPCGKKYAKRHRQIGSSPHKGWKKSLKAEPRRTFITFLLPNSPTGPTFFVLDVLKRHFFPKKNTRLNYNPAFLLDCERELFQKRKKKGDDNRLKWFLSNYDVSGHHQGDQLVVNLNTLKATRHLEFWNPRPWNTSKRFKSSGVFRDITYSKNQLILGIHPMIYRIFYIIYIGYIGAYIIYQPPSPGFLSWNPSTTELRHANRHRLI